MGAEQTFPEDVDDLRWMERKLLELAERVSAHVQRSRFVGRTVTLKATYADFEKISRSRTLEAPVSDAQTLWRVAVSLIDGTDIGPRKVRLLGITLSTHESGRPRDDAGPQLRLPFMEDAR